MAEGDIKPDISQLKEQEDIKPDISQLKEQEDIKPDISQLKEQEDIKPDISQLNEQEDIKPDISQLKEHENQQRYCNKLKFSFQYIWSTIRQFKKRIAVIIPLVGVLIFLLSTVVDVILFNAIPSTEGEFCFRDIRESSPDVKWKIFNNTQGDAWKTHIFSQLSSDLKNKEEKLGGYELATATIFIQTRGHSKRSTPMGPADSPFISFILQKKNRFNIYLTLEKVSKTPEVVKLVVRRSHHGGIYAQLSASRDASLRTMNNGYKRGNLDIGTIRWKAKTGSVVTLERFLRYYTQTSAHLAPGYNYYSRNCKHFVVAVVKLLKQLQDFDLGSETVEEIDEKDRKPDSIDEKATGGLGRSIIIKVLRALGTDV